MKILSLIRDLKDKVIKKISFINRNFLVIKTSSNEIFILEVYYSIEGWFSYYECSASSILNLLEDEGTKLKVLLIQENIFSNKELNQFEEELKNKINKDKEKLLKESRKIQYERFLVLKKEFEKEGK